MNTGSETTATHFIQDSPYVVTFTGGVTMTVSELISDLKNKPNIPILDGLKENKTEKKFSYNSPGQRSVKQFCRRRT